MIADFSLAQSTLSGDYKGLCTNSMCSQCDAILVRISRDLQQLARESKRRVDNFQYGKSILSFMAILISENRSTKTANISVRFS